MGDMNEIITTISTFISSVGFPIVACCLMFYQNNRLTETLSKNTEAILELKTIITGGKKDEN